MKIVKGNSLADIRPDMARLWHPTLNEDLTPQDVAPKSGLPGGNVSKTKTKFGMPSFEIFQMREF